MMKKITLFFFLALPVFAFAQPENDDCAGLIDLGVAPACPDTTFFSNVGATPSDIGFGNIPDCFNGGTVGNDVWFAFTASDTIFDYTITVTGLSDPMGSTPLSSPQVALYRGICEFDNLAEIACASAELEADVIELDVEGLTPNAVYFIRITDYSATATPNWGTFQLCVEEQEPASTIDEGGSTSCSGILYDSGGPDGDYSNEENNTFTICPDQPHDCILFTLTYYNLEPGGFIPTDVLSFYDGDAPDPATLISQLGDGDFLNNDEGGGGVCFQVQATSGCLTVEFVSDGTSTFEGFEGQWECQQNCEPLQPITVNGNVTESEIVNFVSTPNVQAEITNINCPEQSYGTFEGGDLTDLGLERGLLLTSGSRDYATGPNTGGGGASPDTDNGAPGDPDLDYLSTIFGEGTLSQNACVVEFDVFVAANELSFEYVFASEEYPEFVNTTFNDIFAFLVSGPGINGDPNLANNAINIATLPDGTPVQINSVNNLLNWEYYRNNLGGASLQYDGMTSDFLGVKKSLTANIEVEPCNTYSLKLAIADRGDASFDSGVFVSELKGGTPNLEVQFNSGIDYLVEDCVDQDDEVLVNLSEPVEDSTTFVVTVSGTAENGMDYILNIPDTVLFEPGQNELSFPLTTLSDMETEGTETLILTLSNDFGCGEVIYTELVIELRDQIVVDIEAPQDTVLVCADSSIVLNAQGAASYFWSPVNVFDEPTATSPTASPEESQWVTVEGIVGPCVDFDSVYLQLVDPQIMATPEDTVAICQGDEVQLNSTNNVNNQNLAWSPAIGLSDSTLTNPVAQPEFSTDYVVSVNVAGCVVSDTVVIDVAPFDFPDLQSDTTLCENFSVQLGSFIDPDETTTSFEWSPAATLDSDTISNPIATPETTTTYELFAESANGACSQTGTVTVEVLPADVEIQGADSLEICLGTVVDLEAVTSTGEGANIIWSPDNGTISDTSGLTTAVTTDVTDWYFATFTAGTCTVFDSVFIRVDSLPDTEIMADPFKEKYCPGEVVTLSSPVYEPSFFPDIEFQWVEPMGAETPDTLWNLVLTTQDTFLYERVTTNRACSDTASILLNVQQVPIATLTPSDTTVCLGDPVAFQLEIEGQYDSFEWMGEGLSCTDCFDPTANPASGSYTVEIDADGCDASVSASVRAEAPPELALTTENNICPGESVTLNEGGPYPPEVTFDWSSPDSGFSSSESNPVVSPTGTTTYAVVADNGFCPPVEGELTVVVVPVAAINSVSVEPLSLCEGESVDFNVEATGISDGDLFEWTDPSGTRVFQGTSTSGNFEATQSGTYTLTYISANECGTLTETVELEVLPAPVADLANDTIICLGESVQLNFESDENTTYTWTSTDPLFSDFNEPQPVVSPTETATYTLAASNGACPDFEGSVTVQVIGEVFLNIMPDAFFLCPGSSTGIFAEAIGGSDGDTFVWSGSDGTTYTGDSITVMPEDSTVYTLEYTSGGGCTALTDSVLIEVGDGVGITGLDVVTDSLVTTYFEGDDITLGVQYVSVFAPEELEFIWTLNYQDSTTTLQSGLGLDTIDTQLLNTGDYFFQVEVITPDGCSYTADITLTADPIIVAIPNTFTPNGDNTNDTFNFLAQANADKLEVLEFKVYNRWGQLIYDNDTPSAGWDGNNNGNAQPTEVYFYLIRLARPNGFELGTFQGDVTLIR